jgi:hypothetical protein
MIPSLIIALLGVALIFALWRLQLAKDAAATARWQVDDQARTIATLREDEEKEELRADEAIVRWHDLDKINAEHRDRILELEARVAKLAPKPARMRAEDAMSEEAIAELLHGMETNPILRAVCAKLQARIVEASDKATDAPRETLVRPNGEVIAGYNSEQRLHDAGGAAHLAMLLAELQELAKPREPAAVKEAA